MRRKAASVTVALSKEVNPAGTLQSEEVTRLALCSLKEDLKRRRIGLILLMFPTNDDSLNSNHDWGRL